MTRRPTLAEIADGVPPVNVSEVWRNLKPDAGPSPITSHGHQLDLLGETS